MTDAFATAQNRIDAAFVEDLVPHGEWRGADDYYCLSPLRGDKSIGSFHISRPGDVWVYKDFATGDSGDVIELAAHIWGCEPVEAAKKITGEWEWNPAPKPEPEKRPRGRPALADPVALDFEVARNEVYRKSRILEIAAMIKVNPGQNIKGFWWYKNEKGQVEGLDVRFEKEIEENAEMESRPTSMGSSPGIRGIREGSGNRIQKFVITFWYDGKSVRTGSAPVLIFGRDQIANRQDATVIIHEGSKCAEIAQKALPEFVHLAWSGGAQKAGKADWSCLKGRTAIVYPDFDEPGREAAFRIKSLVSGICDSFQIRRPLESAVLKFGPGSDIVEALAVASPEELAEYLKNGPELEAEKEKEDGNQEHADSRTRRETVRHDVRIPEPEPAQTGSDDDHGGYSHQTGDYDHNGGYSENAGKDSDPFRILGVADDGTAYYIDYWGRLQKWRLESLTKEKLRLLAPHIHWWGQYQKDGKMGKLQWEIAIEDLTQMTGKKDFDTSLIRGYGAWKEPDGRMCYHDGETVIGETDPKWLYVRKPRRDIGLSDAPATVKLRREMLKAATALAWEDKDDLVRCLGWSVLAPFCGALPWRPTGFITGKSQSGKTTAVQMIVKPLSLAEICSGAASSEAGIRQSFKNDAVGIIVEEAEDDSEEKKKNRDKILGYARQCTSDDAPHGWKGTTEGISMKFSGMKMFFFVAISPLVDSSADANRIFQVRMKTNPDDTPEVWSVKADEVRRCFSPENCRAVRSFVWQHLGEIITYARSITGIVHAASGHSTRYSFLEAILFAAFMTVFDPKPRTDAEVAEFVGRRYAEHAIETPIDESERMLERIFNESVPIIDDPKDRATLGKILYVIANANNPPEGQEKPSWERVERYKKTAELYGLYFLPRSMDLAVYGRYENIRKILGTGLDYDKILRRHQHAGADSWRNCKTPTGQKWCVVLGRSVIETEPPF